jgi:dTMP kinase
LFFAQHSARAMWRAAKRPPPQPANGPDLAGKLIAFEGVEGAGKSTQAARLADFLRARGHQVVTTREPGGTPVAEAIRALLLDTELDAMDHSTEALLYAAARAEHVAKVIRPALERGAIVITDRYLDSSLAYQGHARGLGIDEVEKINDWATASTTADLVVLLHLDVERGLERARQRGSDRDGVDRLEAEATDFHRTVATGFTTLAQRDPDRFLVIAADADVDTVAERVQAAVAQRLGLTT